MNNKFGSSLLILAAGGLMLAGSATAQTATPAAGPGVVDPGHPRVNQVDRREGRQQQRIGNGVKNGTLTPKQTAHLEKREAAVQKTEQKDMAEHNGHLTKVEQKNLNHRENRISRSIKRDKASNK